MKKVLLFFLLSLIFLLDVFGQKNVLAYTLKRKSETNFEIIYEMILENQTEIEIILTLFSHPPCVFKEDVKTLVVGFDLQSLNMVTSADIVYPITKEFPLSVLPPKGKITKTFRINKLYWNNLEKIDSLCIKIGWIFSKDIPFFLKLPINSFGLKEKRSEEFLKSESIEEFSQPISLEN